MISTEDALRRNYELGIIHGQRGVMVLPQTIIQLRDEAFKQQLKEMTDGSADGE